MQISILGCGWLGFPLAQSLIEKKRAVKGSTTTESKLATLEKSGIIPFQISLEEEKINGKIEEFLTDSTSLIIDIPPKLRKENSENFVSKIKTLLPFIEKSSITNVLFISSTSVYADDNSVVTEETIPNPETESGRQLLEVEKILYENSNFQTTVLRFGGLIGPNRHPIHFLSGKINLDNPDAPVNLIHQEDCIAIIHLIIQHNYWGQLINAVNPTHPTRKNYYTQKAKELALVLPQFNESQDSNGKTIRSDKLIRDLGYDFKNLS
jgi:nucleoside-diphosphate-sugar epimerase